MELHPLAIGAIVAALITGILSVLGLVISKEQKTSEFRQQWIDDLRREVSELLACVEAIRLYGIARKRGRILYYHIIHHSLYST